MGCLRSACNRLLGPLLNTRLNCILCCMNSSRCQSAVAAYLQALAPLRSLLVVSQVLL
jgi:hypothetical protein